MASIHKEIIVKGKVQGVFFRATAREVAERLGVRGRIKNRPDGTVWIAVEGEEAQLEQFLAWCRQGPPRAQVTELDIADGPLEHYTDFQMIR